MEDWLRNVDRRVEGDESLQQPWRSLRRKDEVRATTGPTAFSVMTNCSSDYYTCLADDSSLSKEEREAAMLLSVAEGHLEEDDSTKGLKAAEDALALFRKATSSKGVADALRLIVRARVMKGERKKALVMAKEELKEFQMGDDRRGEAAMLLSVAEVYSGDGGSRAREDALRSATEARTLLKQVKDTKMEAAACLMLSDLHSKRAEMQLDEKSGFTSAMDMAKDAQALFRDLGDKKGEGRALHALGIACGNLTKFQDAVQYAKKSLAVFEDLGDKQGQGFALCVLAQTYLMKDSVPEAQAEAQKALDLFQEVDNATTGELVAMEVLFQIHVLQDELEAALLLAEEGLERFQDECDRQSEVSAWYMIYRAHIMNDQLLLARNAATNAEAILMELGDKRSQANLYLAAIELYFRRQQPDKLLQAALWAVRLFEQLENAGHEQSNAYLILMDVHMARGETTEALLAATKSRELAVKDGDRKLEAIALLAASNIHSLSGQYHEAQETAEEARGIFKEGGSAKGEAKALHMLSKVHTDNKNWYGALDAARSAKALMQELGDRVGVVQLLILTSDVELVLKAEDASGARKLPTKDKDKSLEAAKEALALARKVGENTLVIDAMYMLAQVHLVSARLEEGMKVVSEAVALCQEELMEKEEGRMLVLCAWAHFLSNNLDKAQEAAGQGLELLQKFEDSTGEALANEVLGYINERKAGPKQHFVAAEVPEEFAQDQGAESQVVVQEEYQGPTVEVLARRLHVMVKDMFDVDELENDTMLMDIGIDSLSMLDFQARIAREFPGVTWSPTMLFDYPTLQELGEFMHEALENAFSKKR